ncbi:transcription factor 12-like isoform X3 [Rhopilema esculentum]|uniref:transcription factor 12-like isoform X3 n=1 Tax=Rhopilema esculentum TaxID=499914 RepID=UPI0031D4E92F
MNLGNTDKELSDLLDFSATQEDLDLVSHIDEKQQCIKPYLMFTQSTSTSSTRTNGSTETSSTTRSGSTMEEGWNSYESRNFEGQNANLFGEDDSELLTSSRKALSTANFTSVSGKSKDPFSAMLFSGTGQGIGGFQSNSEVGMSSPDWRRFKSSSKNSSATIRSVYSPTPEDMLSQGGDPNLQYASPKGGISSGDSYYMDHGSPDPWGHHITSNRTQPGTTVPSGYSSIQAEMNSTQVQPSSPYMYTSMSPPINGVPTSRLGSGGTQTADALGKALASMYSTDTHSNPSYSSNPSTPVASPPPLISDRALAVSAAPPSGNAWVPQGQTHSPPYDNLHTLSRMEERLDDAIWVLKSHAENPTMRGMPPMGYPAAAYPQGMTEALQSQPVIASDNDIEATSNILSNSSLVSNDNQSESISFSADSKPSKAKEGKSRKRPAKADIQIVDRKQSTQPASVQSVDSDGSGGDRLGDDEPRDGEKKVVREQERRFANNARERSANNARERLRVRDINEAFKELGRMCSLHLKTEKPQTKVSSVHPQTKLMVIHQAVSVIQSLEGQVRERNLNPKAACLKRREEEKIGEDSPDKRMAMGALSEGSKRGNRRAPSSNSRRGYPDPLEGTSGLVDTAIFTH